MGFVDVPPKDSNLQQQIRSLRFNVRVAPYRPAPRIT